LSSPASSWAAISATDITVAAGAVTAFTGVAPPVHPS
jgi:hypothetical protein